MEKCKGEPAFYWLFDDSLNPNPLNRNLCNFNYSKSIIQTCLLNSAFYSLNTLRLHSTEQYIHQHNTNYTIQKYMQITQCKLHAGMRPHVHNKCFNWLALDMIQCFNTRARALKRARDVIVPSNIIFNSLQGLHR